MMSAKFNIGILVTILITGCAGGYVGKDGKPWVEYESNLTKVTNYYNPSSVVRNGSLIRVEVLENDMRDHRDLSSQKFLYELECVKGSGVNKVRRINSEFYSQINMMGDIQEKQGISGWGQTTMGTYHLAEILCNK
jgi:hypothetical protein